MPEPSNNSYQDGESASDSLQVFNLSLVNDNPEGWGPNDQPEKYKDLPYQKFSKSDKIGKVILTKSLD